MNLRDVAFAVAAPAASAAALVAAMLIPPAAGRCLDHSADARGCWCWAANLCGRPHDFPLPEERKGAEEVCGTEGTTEAPES